jgi:hypothetical protein
LSRHPAFPSHKVETKYPEPKRLVMAGQNGADPIIKAALALLAPVALPMPVPVIMPVASDGGTITVGAADAIRPLMLALIAIILKARRALLEKCGDTRDQSSSSFDAPSASSFKMNVWNGISTSRFNPAAEGRGVGITPAPASAQRGR